MIDKNSIKQENVFEYIKEASYRYHSIISEDEVDWMEIVDFLINYSYVEDFLTDIKSVGNKWGGKDNAGKKQKQKVALYAAHMNTIDNFLKLITDARSLSENLMMNGNETEGNSESEELEYRVTYSILPVTKHVCDTYKRLGYTSVRIIKRIDKPKWKKKNIDTFLLLFQDYKNIDGTSNGCEKPKFSFEDFLSLSIDILEKGSQDSNEVPLTCLKPDVFSGFAGDRKNIRFYVMHNMSTAISRRHFNQFKGC
jgi:hypothetical protein